MKINKQIFNINYLYDKLFKAKAKNSFIQLFRYGIAAAAALVVDTFLLFTLTEYFGVHYLLSKIIGNAAGIFVNYILNVLWVFHNRRYSGLEEFSLFVLTGLIGMAVNILILWFFTEIVSLHYMISNIFVIIIGYFVRFYLRKYILFRDDKADGSKGIMDKIEDKIKAFFNLLKTKLNKKFFINLLIVFLLLIVFCMTYRQGPLYRSNQHTKFLHGLAMAGYGNLKNDWTANTIDPLPVFTSIVFIVYKFMHEYVFYILFMVIIAFYIYSISKLNFDIFKYNNNLQKLVFFIIFLTLHSTVLFDSLTYKYLHTRLIEWFFENGVADQYLIGRLFQPCVFGVFLLFSIYLFYKERYYISVIFLGVAANIHTAYLFSAAILTLAYMIYILIYKRSFLTSFFIGVISLILVVPIILFNYFYLGPTDPETMKKSLDIIVHFRIPQHSIPLLWINASTFVKIGLISAALFIIRKTRIFLIILIPFITAIVFTIIQIFIKSDFIAFLHPWRVSVWLVPISTGIIIGYLVSLFSKTITGLSVRNKKIAYIFCGFVLLANFSLGMNGFIKEFKNYLNIDHGPMMNFVEKNKKIDDKYLIPVDMSDFRLNTGAPILITEKTHPYKDVELIEWYDRILLAIKFYDSNTENRNEIIKILKNDYKITSVVLKKKHFFIKSDLLEEYYNDGEYAIRKIK